MEEIEFHTLKFELAKKFMTLTLLSRNKKQEVLKGEIGQTVVSTGKFSHELRDENTLVLDWSGGSLKVSHEQYDFNNRRYTFNWLSRKPSKLTDTYDMSGAHWFGAGQVKAMAYPMEKLHTKMAPFLTNDSEHYGSVQERYFLSSGGAALHVDEEVPLQLSINKMDGKNETLRLVLQAEWDSPYKNINKAKVFLSYSLFQSNKMNKVHEVASGQVIPRPTGIPDPSLFAKPVWSTLGRYKTDINQDKILAYAMEIQTNCMSAAQIQIDDDWTPSYGDMDFDRKKFGDARGMLDQLKDKGMKTTVWVHPFASATSDAQKRGDFWVSTFLPGGLVPWWNGVAKLLDVTRADGLTYFKGALAVLQEAYGVDSFHFDGGEVSYLPKKWGFSEDVSNPNVYATKYAEMAHEADAEQRSQSVRVGVRTQHLPMFVRTRAKDSDWNEGSGLKSVIPEVLTLGVIGYPFLMTDIVGCKSPKKLPDRELYIRWVEACTLMPGMVFSVGPWQYDDETVTITQKMLAIRERYSELLIQLAEESVQTGAPIVRPMWWAAGRDEAALMCDSQFMLGDGIVVAPVVDEGADARHVYLPPGSWTDEASGETLIGGKYHFNYKAALDELLIFTKNQAKPMVSVSSVDEGGDEAAAAAAAAAVEGEGGEEAVEGGSGYDDLAAELREAVAAREAEIADE